MSPDEIHAEIIDYKRRQPWAMRIVPPLLGFELDGSDAARQAFTDSLRMVVFRP